MPTIFAPFWWFRSFGGGKCSKTVRGGGERNFRAKFFALKECSVHFYAPKWCTTNGSKFPTNGSWHPIKKCGIIRVACPFLARAPFWCTPTAFVHSFGAWSLLMNGMYLPTNGSWQRYKKYGKISRRAKILLIIHDKSVLHSYGMILASANIVPIIFGVNYQLAWKMQMQKSCQLDARWMVVNSRRTVVDR